MFSLIRMMSKNDVSIATGVHLITVEEPSSAVSEYFRSIRTNIKFAQLNKQINSLLITSSIPNEGKSTFAANLAYVMGQTDKKILLVDADLRKSTVHLTFKLNNKKGLTNLLIDPSLNFKDVIHFDETLNLHILPSGSIPPNPSELLSSLQMEVLIKQLSESYSFIIYDAPPVSAVTDPQILASKVDAVMLITRYGFSKTDEVRNTVKTLRSVDANILGYVMNGDPTADRSNYYKYYHEPKVDTYL